MSQEELVKTFIKVFTDGKIFNIKEQLSYRDGGTIQLVIEYNEGSEFDLYLSTPFKGPRELYLFKMRGEEGSIKVKEYPDLYEKFKPIIENLLKDTILMKESELAQLDLIKAYL